MGRAKNPTTGRRGRVQVIKAVGAAFDSQNLIGIASEFQAAVLIGIAASVFERVRARENTTFSIMCLVTPNKKLLIIKGRLAWCVRELLTAGDEGITAYGKATPHVSDYIRRLRKDYGLQIETEREKHGGLYPGVHARYRLKSQVQVVWEREVRR